MKQLKLEKSTSPIPNTDCYISDTGLIVFDSIENDKRHISISHTQRLPTYEEMKQIRYKLASDVKYMAQIFPPKEEFVNLHLYCLHLWEIEFQRGE